MSPVEAAVSAIARSMGADPNDISGFIGLANVGLEALIAHLPPELGEALRDHLNLPKGQ
jgi:hypothetical protein